jgi:PEP-CTERM motif-containing protein
MRQAFIGAAIGAILAASPISVARASVINMTFTGVVDGAFGDVNVGDPFALTISYESTTANLGNSTFGVFNALLSLNVTAGTFVATSFGAPELQMDNNPGGGNHDRFAVVSRASDGLTGTNSGIPVGFFFLRLDDSTDSVFSTASVLPTVLSLASFDSNSFGIFFKDIDSSISGHITDISRPSEVPLPATLPLFLAGLGVLGLLGRRRRNGSTSLAG